MDWKPGLIVRIKDYKFDDDSTIRDKYSIVLFTDKEHAYLIHSLTTSQNNFNVDASNYGCSVYKSSLPYYLFPKGQVIGSDNYFFDKDTFIFFQSNIRKERFEKFEASEKQSFGITRLGILTNEELKRVIKCAMKSKFIPFEIEKELSNFKSIL